MFLRKELLSNFLASFFTLKTVLCVILFRSLNGAAPSKGKTVTFSNVRRSNSDS